MPKPRKGPFHHPPFGLHHEPRPQARRNMKDEIEVLVDKRHRRTLIPLIPTKGLHRGIFGRRPLEHGTPGNSIGVIGRMDLDVQ